MTDPHSNFFTNWFNPPSPQSQPRQQTTRPPWSSNPRANFNLRRC
ncbi:BnaC06g42720D [Brassica napus]|uniref:BnaC06g42720D protein n=1 Tax=Brassica napus TaxID=3708 RepID=A0A078J4T3_BRANA|nr:BnaC06g42720D [Brassica napus]